MQERVPPPGGATGASNSMSKLVTLAQATRLLISGCKASHFSVLMHWVAYPVDLGITTDGLMVRINADDLVKLVSGVLADPVAVQHSQLFQSAANTFLKVK